MQIDLEYKENKIEYIRTKNLKKDRKYFINIGNSSNMY